MEVLFTSNSSPRFKLESGDNPSLLRLDTLMQAPNVESNLSGRLGFGTAGKPELVVEGPVTAETPIEFGGDVVVEGDINEGATVRVTGSLEIRGSVNGGTVRSGGSIVVHREVRHAHLEAIGDITASGAESATIHCEGNLNIRADLKFCNTEVGGLARAGGRIFGGHLVADQGVRALAIGNRTEIRTQVMVVPDARRRVRIAQLEGELARDNARLAICQGTAGRISGHGALSARLYLAEREQRFAQEALACLEELSALKAHPRHQTRQAIVVDQGIFPGVELQVNQATLPVSRILAPGRFGDCGGHIVNLNKAC